MFYGPNYRTVVVPEGVGGSLIQIGKYLLNLEGNEGKKVPKIVKNCNLKSVCRSGWISRNKRQTAILSAIIVLR